MFGGFKRGREVSCGYNTGSKVAQIEQLRSYEQFAAQVKLLKMLCRTVVSGPHETYVDSQKGSRLIITNNAPCDTVRFQDIPIGSGVVKEKTSISLNGTVAIVNNEEIDTKRNVLFSKVKLDELSGILQDSFYTLYSRLSAEARDRFVTRVLEVSDTDTSECMAALIKELVDNRSSDIGEVALTSV